MYIVVGLALGLILSGLLMVFLCKGIEQPLLNRIVYWTGIGLVVIGLVLLLTPVLIWINVQLRSMLGV
jgi:hypothetical protein